MQTFHQYLSPLGKIFFRFDEGCLLALWFEGQKYAPSLIPSVCAFDTNESILVKKWLDQYFGGLNLPIPLPLTPKGTAFQQKVWQILLKIPYGETVTYGDIAQELSGPSPLGKMSAQAVGGAVGRNPIAIMIPCHRVIGANGSLTGYAAGINRKHELLLLEKKSIGF